MSSPSSRKHISDHTKLAVMVTAWLEIPYEIAKSMTEDEIIGLIEIDHHPHRKADGGPDFFWNLRPLLRDDHKFKTKHDAADMAKERSVRSAVDEHAQRMLLKGMGFKKPLAWAQTRWPSRPFPKRVVK